MSKQTAYNFRGLHFDQEILTGTDQSLQAILDRANVIKPTITRLELQEVEFYLPDGKASKISSRPNHVLMLGEPKQWIDIYPYGDIIGNVDGIPGAGSTTKQFTHTCSAHCLA